MGNVGITRTVAQEWGALLDQRQRGRARLHQHAPDRAQAEGRRARASPRSSARRCSQRIPHRPLRRAGGHRQRGAVLLVAAVRLRHRSGDQRLGRHADSVSGLGGSAEASMSRRTSSSWSRSSACCARSATWNLASSSPAGASPARIAEAERAPDGRFSNEHRALLDVAR